MQTLSRRSAFGLASALRPTFSQLNSRIIHRQCASQSQSTTSSSAKAPLSSQEAPAAAHYLGYAGAIPFGACALATLFAPLSLAEFSSRAAQMYGSSVLSFLGAVHWGVALRSTAPRTVDFCYGVVPSLIGAAAALTDPVPGLALLTPSFLTAFAYDTRRFSGDPKMPKWYLQLRAPLTLAAVAGLTVTLGASTRLRKRESMEEKEMTVEKKQL